MSTDLTVSLENRPGTLAVLGEALGQAGINIEGMCGFPCEGRGIIHVLVEDGSAARSALESAGLQVTAQREVLRHEAEDRPGMLGETARRVSAAGVNIDLLYKATRTELVLGVDDLEKARQALQA